MTEIERKLVGTAKPYWKAEAAIARRFFKRRPTRDDQIFWLKAQLWKELHPVDGYFTGLHKELSRLVELFPLIDRDIDRHRYHSLLEQLVQEFNHYVLLADALQYLLGRPITADDTHQLPQERKLGEVRRRRATSGSPVDKAGVLVTEGGGARMFREARKIKGGPLEKMIAEAMEVIYQDEKNHYKEAARQASEVIATPADLKRAQGVIREISLQRVYMRNEMFGGVLSDKEIEKIRGKRCRHA